MSENKPTTSSGIELPPEPTTDITGDNLTKLTKYIEDGLPDVSKLTEEKMRTMLTLYLDGRTYSSIARAMAFDTELVVYASHKFNWFNIKKQYLVELSAGLEERTINAKILARDAIVSIVSYLKVRIGDKMNNYLRTRNEEDAKGINLKEMALYIKLLDMLTKNPDNPESGGKNPLVGVNAGQGVVIKRTGENSVEVTPKDKTVGDALQYFADLKRAEEKKKKTIDAEAAKVDNQGNEED